LAFPPADTSVRHGIVCEGNFEIDQQLQKRINSSSEITAINGGVFTCANLQCKITHVIGDKIDLQKLPPHKYKSVLTTRADRMKTHLESAIENARNNSPNSFIMVYGALTRRIDKVINSLFLLLRDPGRLFLESRDEIAFGYNSKMGNIEVDMSLFKTISFFPINGSVTDLIVTEPNNGATHLVKTLAGKVEVYRPETSGKVMIRLREGEMVIHLHKEQLWPTNSIAEEANSGSIRVTSFQNKKLLKVIEYLFHLSITPYLKLISDTESISLIREGAPYSGVSLIGRVVSLIAFGGPVYGIKTEGLKWEYGQENSRNDLHRDFIGMSNVVKQNQLSIKVLTGNLLFVITNDVQTATDSPTLSPISITAPFPTTSFPTAFNLDNERKEMDRKNSDPQSSQSSASSRGSPATSSRRISTRPPFSHEDDTPMSTSTPTSSQESQGYPNSQHSSQSQE
jgi:thiamine pyrophosphokinase